MTGNLTILENFQSGLIPSRTIGIWTPESYTVEPTRHFPVIFMHDGEKVFRGAHIGSGNWGMRETITRLANEGKIKPAIVVGIWSTENRAGEYMPQKALQGPKAALFHQAHENRVCDLCADHYLKFIVEELKPYIDQHYRTLSTFENTFIMGSSRGALTTLYALAEYPQIFKGAACLSPHWPVGDGIVIDWLLDHLPTAGKHRIYFDHGTESLDADYEPYQIIVDALMTHKGYHQDLDWVTQKFNGAGHSEADWRARVHLPLQFLLGQKEPE
jgi:predicted alpha/beta superfamily hydrolase